MDPANGTWSAGAIDRPIHDASCRFSRNQAGRRKPALRRAGRSRKRFSADLQTTGDCRGGALIDAAGAETLAVWRSEE